MDKPEKKLEKLEKRSKQVKLCRDFFEGASKVLTKEYLPQWESETKQAYEERFNGTTFTNMFSSIVSGLTGVITARESIADDTFDGELFKDVDMRGSSLSSFVKDICESSLVAGIEFISVQSTTDKKRSYFKRYSYESLQSYIVEDGKVIQMVFKDSYEQAKGAFGMETVERMLVFKIGGGEVWYKEGKGELKKQSEWTNTLTELPITAVTTGKQVSLFDVIPRLYDIARMNQSYLIADTKEFNLLSFEPVAVFFGDMNDDAEVEIGKKDALVFEDKITQGVMYVEPECKMLIGLGERKKNIAENIDKVSFSFLKSEGQKTVVEAKHNQTKNTSFLSGVAEHLEIAVNRLYYFKSIIEGFEIKDGARIVFKKDFDDLLITDAGLKLQYEMVRAGDLSRETFWERLKMLNSLPKDFDSGKESEKLQAQAE
jgi:hypothetical protein